jgi:hypothetical protein
MSDYSLAGFAIVISLFSLGISAYVAYRDHGKVSASARYLESYQHMSDGIYIHVVNSGRRPVTIRRLILKTSDGKVIEEPLRNNKNPIRLLESEDYEFQLNAQNSEIHEWSKSTITKAIVEDSRGKAYNVSNLVEAINSNAEHLQAAL